MRPTDAAAWWMTALVGVVLVGSGHSVQADDHANRVLHKEVIVHATPEQVWHAWTTPEGLADWWVQDGRIELEVLGPYELYLVPEAPEGSRGTEGSRVLSYLPHEMFSFEWAFPPGIPALRNAGAKTHVVLHFDDLGDGAVRVRLDQLGWQDGEDWEKGFAYFNKAWDWVFGQLQTHFAQQAARVESWIDGAVMVTAQRGADRLQRFEVVVPADTAALWAALTTAEGVRSFLSPDPRVELAPGGAYALFPESTARILSFVPERQLAITGSAPLEFPNVRMGGTWAVLDLAPDGENATHLTMTCLGWQNGEEWERAFEYFLKNNAMFLNLLRKRFTEGPLKWSQPGNGEHATFTRMPLE